MSERIYLSTTIPYVNARPHLGHALELVQADVLARHHRQRGDEVWFQTGTDDNSLKQVLAAQAEGVAVGDLVSRNAAAFEGLGGTLELSFDDFSRPGSDPRHRPAADRAPRPRAPPIPARPPSLPRQTWWRQRNWSPVPPRTPLASAA